ncbi:MAG: hypothetical protein IJ719_11150 [Clostridia bacterium]|nr:hypothetical protein [Clostridia bacterium]
MKRVLFVFILLLLLIISSIAFAGRAGSSSSSSSYNSSRVGSSSSYAYKPIYVHVKSNFILKKYPWNASTTLDQCTRDDDLLALAKYRDSGNGIYWIKVEFPYGSGKYGWAAEKHFDITPDEFSDLPYEEF